MSCLIHRLKNNNNKFHSQYLHHPWISSGRQNQPTKPLKNKSCGKNIFCLHKILLYAGVGNRKLSVSLSCPRIQKSSEQKRETWDYERSPNQDATSEQKLSGGWVCQGCAGEAGGAPHKGEAKRSAALHHQSRLDRALRRVPSMPIPEEHRLGTEVAGSSRVAGSPGAWACSCRASFSPGLCYAFRTPADAFEHGCAFIYSPYILELVYFTFSLLIVIAANTDSVLSVFPRWLGGKESACQGRRHRRCGFNPRVWKIPLEAVMATPVVLLEKSHGQRSLTACSPWSRRVRHDWALTHLALF